MAPVLRAGPAAPQKHANPHLDWLGPATLDWCEENYAVMDSIAEFWNTFSNLVMIILGLVGLRWSMHLQLPARFHLAFVGLLSIGVGSNALPFVKILQR